MKIDGAAFKESKRLEAYGATYLGPTSASLLVTGEAESLNLEMVELLEDDCSTWGVLDVALPADESSCANEFIATVMILSAAALPAPACYNDGYFGIPLDIIAILEWSVVSAVAEKPARATRAGAVAAPGTASWSTPPSHSQVAFATTVVAAT